MFWKKSPTAVLLVMLFMHLLAHIDRNMLLGFSPQIIKDLALSNAQYGFLVGAVWVLSFGFMAMVMGSLADRFSRTRVIAAGVLIWSVCTWASGYAQSFEQMVVARFFVASGEAALVPAATALLTELFSDRRRGIAMGIFFMGIPMGIGCSFLLAGSFGASYGWRGTFYVLGVTGIVIALPLTLLKDDRGQLAAKERGAPFTEQVRAVFGVVFGNTALCATIAGFVFVHLAFVGLAFTQLWLVKERGMDAAGIATRIGALQLLFGIAGCVIGGALGDRLARNFAGRQASFMTLLVAVCAPLMISCRFAPAGSALFYTGMCAGFFLPLAVYGSALSLILGIAPPHMRSTVTGLTMLLINVFAISLGNLAAGAAIDSLSRANFSTPITATLVVVDVLTACSILFFARAARAVARVTPSTSGLAPYSL
jgi:MFS family permease